MWVRFGSEGFDSWVGCWFRFGWAVSLQLLAPYIKRRYQTMQAIFAENFSHHQVKSQDSSISRMVKLVRATGELCEVSNLLRGQPQQVKDLVIKSINLTLEVATKKKHTIIIDDIVYRRNKEERGHHTSASTQLALPDQPAVATSIVNPNQTDLQTAQLVPDSTSNANPNQTGAQANQLMVLRDQLDDSSSSANPEQTDPPQNNQLMVLPDEQDDSNLNANPDQADPQTGQTASSTSNTNPTRTDRDQSGAQIDKKISL